MLEFICKSCKNYLRDASTQCPYCQSSLITAGADKNVIDTLVPDCLIHRYQGSDLLEPAMILKEGKINLKVAIKLKDISKPVTVPKNETFAFDENVFAAINALRDKRCETMRHFDTAIEAHWNELQPIASPSPAPRHT